MDKKGERVQQPTSPARRDKCGSAEAGFTLLETVCVVAILAILAAVLVPALPRGTSRARLESFAIDTAALLKADRNAAVRRGVPIATEIDAESRFIRSGANGRIIRLPRDVAVDALTSARCSQQFDRPTILFFASGLSCGGAIALSRLGVSYEVRVNWLTGGVEIEPTSHS
jgi:general secretion pathway protein H